MEGSRMPTHQQITPARQKAKRIRDCAVSFRLKRAELDRLLVRVAELERKAEAKKNLRGGRMS